MTPAERAEAERRVQGKPAQIADAGPLAKVVALMKALAER